MVLKCLLIKDKPALNESLSVFIEKTVTLTLLAAVADIHEAARVMSKTLPDIVFLDGRLLQQIKANGLVGEKPPVFICIGGYDYNAQNGVSMLQLNTKKLTYEHFLDTVNKAVMQLLGSAFSNNHKDEQFLFIKSEYRIVKINYDDILFCEGLKDYTQIYTSKRSKPIITLQNLKTFSDRLPSKNFVRIHRSYIISLNHIETISKKEVEIGEKIIPIGNSYRNNLLDIIKLNS